MRRAGIYLLGGLALARLAAAEAWPVRPPEVEALVAEAMARNLALHAEAVDVSEAEVRLAQARGQFEPRLDFSARYSVADGGRTIDLPIGDLLNPVYRSLNQLLAAAGQPATYGSVSNETIRFLRPHEQETALRLVQPIYQPEIYYGARARHAEWQSRSAQLASFRRELRLEVESAFYRLQQAELALKILGDSQMATEEAVRSDRALFENDKVTEDRVLRAEADDLAVRQQIAETTRDRNSARAYLNFLLNRPLESAAPGVAPEGWNRAADSAAQKPRLISLDRNRREELLALDRAIAAARAAEDAQRSRMRPTLGLAVEGGVQGDDYHTGSGNNYVLGSLVAEVNVWDGRQRRGEVELARLARRRLELQQEQTREEIDLEIQRASDDLDAAVASLAAAQRRRDASDRAFALVKERQREGLANQLSFLDARQERTSAEINFVITQNRLLIAAAALDRAAAISPLP